MAKHFELTQDKKKPHLQFSFSSSSQDQALLKFGGVGKNRDAYKNLEVSTTSPPTQLRISLPRFPLDSSWEWASGWAWR